MSLCLNRRSIRSKSSNRYKRFERLKRLEHFELRLLLAHFQSTQCRSFPLTMNNADYLSTQFAFGRIYLSLITEVRHVFDGV